LTRIIAILVVAAAAVVAYLFTARDDIPGTVTETPPVAESEIRDAN
jgi:hypothetical protein